MDRRQEFEKLVLAGLAPFREQAVASIRQLLDEPLPPEVCVLWFEVTSTTEGLPVTVLGMDDQAVSEVSVESPPGSNEYLPILSQRLVAQCDQSYLTPQAMFVQFDDEEPAGPCEVAVKLVAGFVRDCYLAAGGKLHPLRAYAADADRAEALNLKNGQWVPTEAIHRRHA